MITNFLLIGHSPDDGVLRIWSGAPKLSPEQVREELRGYNGLWLHSPRGWYPSIEELIFIIEALSLKKNLILTRCPKWGHDESMPIWRDLRAIYATHKTIPLVVENEDLEGLAAAVLEGLL
ncbi:MAG: hypothetical protein EB015_14205 [Methylocystaceae bacterium]|nr:hypothetical protein [Methylocystaceae bacterium]